MKHLTSIKSDFSMGVSILSPKEIVNTAAEYGYESVIMTDNHTLSGMTHLFEASRSLETPIKVVVGATVQVYDMPTYRPPSKKSGEKAKDNPFWQAKLIIKNETGLKALFQLLNVGNQEEYFYYQPRVGIKDLVTALKSDGLILTTGDENSLFAHSNYKRIFNALAKHVKASNIFIELISVKSAYFDKVNKEALSIALSSDIKTIFTRPALYLENSDKAKDVMDYIINKKDANHRLRNIPYNRDLHIMKPEVLQEQAELMKERIGCELEDHSQLIIDSCNYEWEKLDMCLPEMAENEFSHLVSLCKEGFSNRLKTEILGYKPDTSLIPDYKKRLQYELSVLKEMSFDRYFLLVHDVINWSKENGIMVGHARGSAAGSLIAFLIGITDVDPMRFGLIFERFLNPERIDYPDIDTDFMSSRRHEVIQYIFEKYGKDRVAGISNFTSLGAASCIRDVGRIHSVPSDDLKCTRVIEANSTLEMAEELPEIQKYAEIHPEKMDISRALYGKSRSLGRHAAGIVVAGEQLLNRCVVERRGGEPTVNWDKRTVEDWGLIKLDILGLSTLDTLSIIGEKLRKKGTKVNWLDIPLDDKKTLEAFGQGKTVGVFQFTGGGMRKLLKDLSEGGKDLTFSDIYATTALYRPGPLQSGMTEEYVRVKQGITSPSYPHPKTEDALKETRGIIVYQEQVMQIARDLCGYTMGESDVLRKVMGKKDPEKMDKQQEKFVSGAIEHSDMDEDEALELFDQIAKFAGYGFNKSHAVSYSLISYACMYAKIHYTSEFFAAALSIASEDEVGSIVKDAAALGLVVVPPDVNYSSETFEAGYDELREQHILYCPLDRVKQVSSKGVQAILKARSECGGKFKDIEEFLFHIDRRSCNKRVQENLRKVGAFCSIDPDEIDPRHPDRLKDQKELLPNLMMNNVKADRLMSIDGFVASELAKIQDEINGKSEDEHGDPTGITPVVPNFGKKPAFMFITDAATQGEERCGKFADSKSFGYTKSALEASGIKKSKGYYTGLIKTTKADKMVSSKEITTWSEILDKEIELLKPAVIVAAGGAVSRHLCPDIKGGWEDLAGRVIYDVKRDCSIILAPNPQMIYIRPEVQDVLDRVMMDVAEIIS